MTPTTGMRLGIYEITGQLGQGGMGEVYRARDTTLGREVAIKTLPSALAKEPDRLARFEREARLLAALNHPHIAVVYGLDEHEGTKFLAMELIEGETLERKAESELTVDEALRIGLQVAEALEAAHDKGVVHRDLKPANIMVTPNGRVKVLDFGLAKAFSVDPKQTIPANSPALSLAMTQQGFILGTAGYMSPEQASGQPTDQRADIWAFGVVLFELLTGAPLYSGESVPHILADVLRTSPDWSRLPKNLHPRVRLLLERCLEKNVRNRYHSMADARVDLESALADPLPVEGHVGSTPAPARSFASRLVAGAALVLVGAAVAVAAAWTVWPAQDREVTRFSVDLAGPLPGFATIALSPDGRRIVYETNGRLYSQRLDQEAAMPIPGTDLGAEPFFSPTGDAVAFSTPTQLKAVGFGGEAPRVLANVPVSQALGGAWDRQNRVFFGHRRGFGLSWVPAGGGEPEPFAALAAYADVDFPDVLPGGAWVLFTANPGAEWSGSDIVAQNTTTGERKVVMKGGHFARYLPTGHLVFARNGTLYAVKFDTNRVETIGGVVPVVPGIATNETGGNAQYAIASNGTLIYAPGIATSDGGAQSVVVRVNRAGETTPLSSELRAYGGLRVSPDGSRLAVEVMEPGRSVQIWIMDLVTGSATQLTFEGDESRFPVWTPEGRSVLFTSRRGETFSIYRKLADGSGDAERVLDGTSQLVATDVLPGDVLVYQDAGEGGLRDILTFDLARGGSPQAFLATPADEAGARASRDGAWIAYASGSNAEFRVYARPYQSAAGGQRAISEGIGTAPVWSPSGEEINFISGPPGTLMSVPVTATPGTITPARPRELFNYVQTFTFDVTTIRQTAPYDVLPGGDFVGLVAASTDSAGNVQTGAATRVKVVLNWFEELRRLVPAD